MLSGSLQLLASGQASPGGCIHLSFSQGQSWKSCGLLLSALS